MSQAADEIREALLALRCRRGEAEAWSELVARVNPRLRYYFGRFVHEASQVDLLAQELWLKAFRNIKTLRDERRIVPWLYAIAHRVVMTHFREEYARQESSDAAAVDQSGDAADDPQAQFDNAELVHFGLSRIGLLEREVLTLSFIEGLSVAQIAEVLEVPSGTVKSRLHRGRAELRDVIERETGPGGAQS